MSLPHETIGVYMTDITLRGRRRLCRTVLSGAVASLILAVAACGGGGSAGGGDPAADGPPKSGGSVVLALEAESPGYVPGISAAIAYSGSVIWGTVYDGLAGYDQNNVAKPYLAQSITPNADNTEWTVKLPPGLKYGSGDPVKAQDIATIFKDYYTAKGSAVASTFAAIKSVTATDDTTAVFTTVAPYADLPAVLVGFYPFNPNLRAKYGDDFGAHPDGTGAFRMVRWERNNEIVLERNPFYWRKDAEGRQLPYLDNLTFKIIPSGATRNATLEAGGIQGFQSVQPSVLFQSTRLPDAAMIIAPAGGSGWFLNTQKSPTNDVRVRRALADATDRASIIAAQGAGDILTPLDQYFPRTSPYYSAAASGSAPTFDPDSAKRLITEYVNDPTRSDGKPVGEPVTVQLNYIAGDEQSTNAVQVVEQSWSAAGIRVQPNALDEAGWVGAALAGNTQAFWFGWVTWSPAALYRRTYSNPATTVTNWTRLDDKTVQEQIDVLMRCADLPCQQAGAGVIAQRFNEVVPVIPLVSTPNGLVYDRTKLGGARFLQGGQAGLTGIPDLALLWQK